MVMVRMVGAVAMFFKRGGGRGRSSSVVRGEGVGTRSGQRVSPSFHYKGEKSQSCYLTSDNLLRSQLFSLVIIFFLTLVSSICRCKASICGLTAIKFSSNLSGLHRILCSLYHLYKQ